MNPFIKNCRTGFHEDLLNRTSHYCKLLLTNTAIDNKLDNSHRYLLKQKGQEARESRRLQQNRNLVKSLIDIDRKSGTYRSFSVQQPCIRKTMKNQYHERLKSESISEENVRLYRKLVTQQTDFSPKKIKEFDDRVTRYSKLIRHPFLQVCQMDREIYQTYRLQLMKGKMGNSRRNTVDLIGGEVQRRPLKGKYKRRMRHLTQEMIPEKTIQEIPE